jgi:hypothetical protein
VLPLFVEQADEVPDVTLLDFPDDIGFPEVVEGHSDYRIKRSQLPDGNFEVLLLNKENQSRESVVYAPDGAFLFERQGGGCFEPMKPEESK